MVKKLPKGATIRYIQELTSLKVDATLLEDLRTHYPKLYLDATLREQLLEALMKAAGFTKTHGWIFRSYSVPKESVEALRILYELLLTDGYLMQQLSKLSPSELVHLNFDIHLKNPDSIGNALEFIRFLSLSNNFTDYTEYVKTKEGRDVVTKFLQEEHTAPSSSSSTTKRKREDGDEEEEDENDTGITPKKIAKGGKVKWLWENDGVDKWEIYDPQTTLKLEKALLKKQKTCKVDVDRYVDLQNMLQRRYDDTSKRRGVKRVEEDEEEEEEEEDDN